MRWLWGFGLGGRREGGGAGGEGLERPRMRRRGAWDLAFGEGAGVTPRRASRPAPPRAVVALGVLAPGEAAVVSPRRASRPAAWWAAVALGVLAPGEGAGASPRRASRPALPRAAGASRILTRCRPEPSRPSWARAPPKLPREATPARVGGASGSGGRWSRGAWRPESATTPAPRRQHRDARTGRGVERPDDSDALGSPLDRVGFRAITHGTARPPRPGPGVTGEGNLRVRA